MNKIEWSEVSVFAPDRVALIALDHMGWWLEANHARWHFFFGEPGAAAFVLRVEAKWTDGALAALDALRKKESANWQTNVYTNVSPYVHDELAFGDFYQAVLDYFQACSVLALKILGNRDSLPPLVNDLKLFHCFANMLGYSRADEAARYEVMAARAAYFAAEGKHAPDKRGVFGRNFDIPRFDP